MNVFLECILIKFIIVMFYFNNLIEKTNKHEKIRKTNHY